MTHLTVHLKVTGRPGSDDFIGRRLLLVGIGILGQICIRRRRVRQRAWDTLRIELELTLGGQRLGTWFHALVFIVEIFGRGLNRGVVHGQVDLRLYRSLTHHRTQQLGHTVLIGFFCTLLVLHLRYGQTHRCIDRVIHSQQIALIIHY